MNVRKGPEMPSRPNYRQERAQKTRNREAKKEEKLRRREEASARRKALREGDATAPVDPADDASNEETGE